ncbi:MAG: phosphodiesterase [Candidatus Rokuibacteriota bacterium]|nr:MAG: phosphodiesterase [Candidatus Rokubacteria bacterium]
MTSALRTSLRTLGFTLVFAAAATSLACAHHDEHHRKNPQVVVISLDGARPDLVEHYLKTGVLDRKTGLGRLKARGVAADQNITVTPSVTAVAHIAIATGSTAAHNDIPLNTFHPVAASIGTSISGFAAPIGGYQLNPLGPSPAPTAEPLWVQLRRAGKKVVTATWPGSDGADISISNAPPGAPPVSTLVQAATPIRTTDYTVPFGAFGGLGAQGFALTSASFAAADATLTSQLVAAGHVSHSPVRVTAAPVETVFCAPATTATCGTTNASGRTLRYDIKVAALDTTDDHVVNYDTLVFFEATAGVQPGPFALPSSGPAYVKLGGPSAKFFFEGSGNKIGAAYFVSFLVPDLSTVRIARYGANFIPRNAPVLAVVDDINDNVGFWAPQPDFRIPERLSPGFTPFPDLELEAMYHDQVQTWIAYQTAVAVHAIQENPDADLVMIYIEQPDGSGHQFTLTDRRQPTNPTDNTSIGTSGNPPGATGQDAAKVKRYAGYLEFAYQQANGAVEAILNAIGSHHGGEPRRDVFVVSDHGMAPFHTAVSLRNLLANAGVNVNLLGIRTTGPAANIYVNLQGREAGGTVPADSSPTGYAALVAQVAAALRAAKDPHGFYNPQGAPLFSDVLTRPEGCGFPGFCVNENFGQDTGDVVALMIEGYNFDGVQSPGFARLDEGPFNTTTTVYSVPNFYGAHGHNSNLQSMSAIFYAAGPSLKQGRTVDVLHNIDVAPTVMEILDVAPAPTVDGEVITKILQKHKRD